MAKEMYSNITFPEGSILMIGSASHLGRSGTSIYARDWTEVLAIASDTWRGVWICSLVLLILSECPGTILREICELATWFDSVYNANPQGLCETWMCLVTTMESCSTGMTSLDIMESYKNSPDEQLPFHDSGQMCLILLKQLMSDDFQSAI